VGAESFDDPADHRASRGHAHLLAHQRANQALEWVQDQGPPDRWAPADQRPQHRICPGHPAKGFEIGVEVEQPSDQGASLDRAEGG
jgi:hypothetical protein